MAVIGGMVVRSLFLVLLLANLLFAGWRLWVAPPELPPHQLKEPGKEARIRVATLERTARPGRDAGGQTAGGAPTTGLAGADASATPAAAGSSCSRIGPIGDGQVADALRAALAARGLRATTMVEAGQIWVGHWVQLESVPTREAADRMVARLAAGGLPDAYVFQSAPPFSVSLGVFRDKDRADKVAAAAAALGFHPQLTDRYRSGAQYWLYLQVASDALPLGELPAEPGPGLQAESVPCSTMPVGGTPMIN
ncbi:MAG: SPOR domain-containing protein [Gammaproteobacteria bacterium]|nr:MAG: SPOR domain-containing protein [Gammaproteobacteria bacterium]